MQGTSKSRGTSTRGGHRYGETAKSPCHVSDSWVALYEFRAMWLVTLVGHGCSFSSPLAFHSSTVLLMLLQNAEEANPSVDKAGKPQDSCIAFFLPLSTFADHSWPLALTAACDAIVIPPRDERPGAPRTQDPDYVRGVRDDLSSSSTGCLVP